VQGDEERKFKTWRRGARRSEEELLEGRRTGRRRRGHQSLFLLGSLFLEGLEEVRWGCGTSENGAGGGRCSLTSPVRPY